MSQSAVAGRHLQRVRSRVTAAVSNSSQRRCFRATSAVHNDLVTVNVNGSDIDVPSGVTVLQACEKAGIEIPRFCYHDRLSIAGNCRMCLVEVEKSPKPVASCAMPIMPNMKIKTDTPLVRTAREGVMEFLLANHPLDCPICDQGGECDLQDEAMAFGSDKSRFREAKNIVEDKDLGPLVKTVMSRCIQCTRCIRFTTEVAGVHTLGVTGRGVGGEVGTYVETFLDSELSGNIIDLCPVGALTSKPFAFRARPWELRHTETISVSDAVGSNVMVDSRGAEIMRVVPRLNEDVNEEWLDDKSRFSYDGLKRQRIDVPMVRRNGQFVEATHLEAFQAIKDKLSEVAPNEIRAIAGDMACAESLIALKDLVNRLGSDHLEAAGQDLADLRSEYTMNSGIAGVEEADALLIIGSNPRMEAPLVNARIRKSWLNTTLPIGVVGRDADFTYDTTNLGNSTDVLQQIADGKHAWSKILASAERPMILVGSKAVSGSNGEGVRALVRQIASNSTNLHTEDWNGLNFLQLAAAKTAALDIGFVPGAQSTADARAKAKFVYLLGADEIQNTDIASDAFVVYQGHHGDAGASRADVILPGAAFTEKTAIYVNTEGRVQQTQQVNTPLDGARNDWETIRALSEVLETPLSYSNAQEIRQRLIDVAPHFANIDHIEPTSFTTPYTNGAKVKSSEFEIAFDNFWFTNPIARASRVMAKCSNDLPIATNSYVQTSQ